MSFVVRYYYNGTINESFLDFVKAGQLNAVGTKYSDYKMLRKAWAEYHSNLVGQGYDGAAVMSGKHIQNMPFMCIVRHTACNLVDR